MARKTASKQDIMDLLNDKEVVNLVTDENTSTKPVKEAIEPTKKGKVVKPLEPETKIEEPTEPSIEEEKAISTEQTALYAAQLEALRVKMEELEQSTSKEKEAYKKRLDKKYENANKKAEDYDKFLKEEEEKKMSLEEKLLVREKALIEQEEEFSRKLRTLESDIKKKEDTILNQKSKIDTSDKHYKKLLDREVETIDEKFREAAQIIIDGTRDTVTALEKIRDFKEKGLFKKSKEVPVVHATPGVKDGARTDSVKYQQKVQKDLSSEDKIDMGLQQWLKDEKFKGKR